MTEALSAVQAIGGLAPSALADTMSPAVVPSTHPTAFGQMMMEGIHRVDDQLARADTLTRAFALGEDIPLHQVTFALEQARLSVELMMQVRTRLVEGYQEIMRMPL